MYGTCRVLPLLHPPLPVVPTSPHGSTISFPPPRIPRTSRAHLGWRCRGWVDGKGPVVSCKSCFSHIGLGGLSCLVWQRKAPVTGLSHGVKRCPRGRCCPLGINSVCSSCQRPFTHQTWNVRGSVIAGGSRPPRNSCGAVRWLSRRETLGPRRCGLSCPEEQLRGGFFSTGFIRPTQGVTLFKHLPKAYLKPPTPKTTFLAKFPAISSF